MSELLSQLNDEEEDFSVTITDTAGITATYEFLDIVLYKGLEYAILEAEDSEGYVDIFRILGVNGKECYARVTDDATAEAVFEVFRIKNEDEFDFE